MECTHAVRMGTLCGLCGADIAEEDHMFCALYNTDNIRITQEEALASYNKRLRTLEAQQRLIMVLDLDQTILHTVCNAPALRDTTTFSIDGNRYCVKFRPGLQQMLDRVSRLYEIYVYTMGTRVYAQSIVDAIDPAGEYFRDRVITRDENQGLLVKSLDRLFPYKHRNIVVLDDRADVWEFCRNLVLVKPFWYFNQIDINDPLLLKRRIECEAETNAAFKDFTSKKQRAEKIEDPGVINRLEEMALESSTEEEGSDGSRCGVQRSVEEDRELFRVSALLEEIHRRYFRSRHRNVKKILGRARRRIFGSDRFFVQDSGNVARLIRMHGGKVCGPSSRTNFIVSQSRESVEDIARRLQCVVVSPKWIADCAYSLLRVDYGRYVLGDYRVRDEYEDELEALFSGPQNA